MSALPENTKQTGGDPFRIRHILRTKQDSRRARVVASLYFEKNKVRCMYVVVDVRMGCNSRRHITLLESLDNMNRRHVLVGLRDM